MSELKRTWNINRQQRQVSFGPLDRLLDVLRDQLELFSLKEGCGEGECGACSLLLDGELQLACLVAAAQVEQGAQLVTAEGLEQTERGKALRQAFEHDGAVQCGYCSPGMLVGGYDLLSRQPAPTEEQVRVGLAGHLCRCTGYTKIVTAVQRAARDLPQKEQP